MQEMEERLMNKLDQKADELIEMNMIDGESIIEDHSDIYFSEQDLGANELEY